MIGEGTVWASIQTEALEGTNVFPLDRGARACGALAGAGQGGPWLPGPRMGQDVASCFSCKLLPTAQQADLCQT